MNCRLSLVVAVMAALLNMAGCSQHDPPAKPDARSSVLVEYDDFLSAAAISPNGSIIASGASPGEVRIWDVASRKSLYPIPVKTPKPREMVFAPDSKRLFGGGHNGDLFLWDFTSHLIHLEETCGDSNITAVAYSPNGKWLAAAGVYLKSDRQHRTSVKIWESDTGKLVREVRLENFVGALAFTPQQSLLMVELISARLFEIDVKQTVEAPRLVKQYDFGESMSKTVFSRSGKTIASVANVSGKIFLWTADKNALQPRSLVAKGLVLTLAFSPDGKYLVSSVTERKGSSGYPRAKLLLWDVQKGTLLDSLRFEKPALFVSFMPDGQSIVYRDGKTLHLWKRNTKATH